MDKSPMQLHSTRANVLGVGVHAIDLALSCEIIERAIATGTRGYVCVTGVHGVMEAQRDPGFREILNRALLVVPDGMPTVWVGRLQGHAQMRRVFGPDLMRDLCRRSQENGITHFLYGGKPGVSEQLATSLRRLFPAAQIVGWYTPPFRSLSAHEQSLLEATVNKLRPDVFWVGLSTPKQERFMAQNANRLDCGVMIGVGAAFDFHTGTIRDAPQWIKNCGLQWAHRLYQDPRRLWKRYLINNPAFLQKITLQLAGLRHYELDAAVPGQTCPQQPTQS
jgi:N-acetylglucosaminyldiphosphoundecaprenol N-acetyl-beta-D-mannosaminyltransferase